jgi:predicted tellurium resistance membrane protein TerC
MMGVAASYIARLLHRFRWIAWIGLAIILFVAVRMLLEGAGAFVTIPEIPLLYTPHAAAAAVVH